MTDLNELNSVLAIIVKFNPNLTFRSVLTFE